MAKYIIEYTENAIKELQKHKKDGNQATIKKINAIISDLETTPFLGVGKPEALKSNLLGFWSRRINLKDRMIYSVNENIVTVTVVSAIDHYYDK